jgi:anti-anti-sigma factor
MDVLSLRGELGIGSVAQLQPAVEGAIRARRALVVDLVEVSFMDSQGLYALLVLRARLRERSCALAIVCPREGVVATAFDVSGTNELFDIFPTRKAAVAALRRRG